MATIKPYTDTEQSKKLAEILPLESADMCYVVTHCDENNNLCYSTTPIILRERVAKFKTGIPCWSLAALLYVLPKKYYPIKDHTTYLTLSKPKDKWYILYWDATGMQDGEQTLADNPIDACYEMILKLHKLNLL